MLETKKNKIAKTLSSGKKACRFPGLPYER